MAIYDCHMRNALINSFRGIPNYTTGDTYVVHELDICSGASRIDIAVVNGQLHGYEIKSEHDSLMRLASQIEDYNNVFDTLTIVVTKNHLEKVKKIIPSWWGILCVTGSPSELYVKEKRVAKTNKNIDGFRMAQLLWKEELYMVIAERVGITGGLKSKNKRQLARLLADNLMVSDIEDAVRAVLKTRTNWKAELIEPQCGDLHNM